MNRLIRRAILRSIDGCGSKSLTSAAIWTSNSDGVERGDPAACPVTPSSRLRQ